MRRFISVVLSMMLLMSLLPGSVSLADTQAEMVLLLSDEGVTVNGEDAAEDPDATVYLSHDIIYYEDKTTYDSGYPYGEGKTTDRHSAEEAAAHTVVNITCPGTYRLSGTMSAGQVRVNLGENASTDPSAVVTLILDGLDITCTVAPAILFQNVYECDNGWSVETASSVVDTTAAGAVIVLADDSVNKASGAYVARIYKDKEGAKKLWKQDGAVYSYMSMNVNGEEKGNGVLTINAQNEGLDSELHLTINGGHINIFADNDGINTNEDGVSVTTINGGVLHIIAGLGAEGDGIDSNGWLVINGGTVISSANPIADAGLDSDKGSFVNGGTVVALGSTMDWAESDSEQITMNLQFASYNNSDDAIVVTDLDGNCIFAYDPSEDEVVGSNIRRYMGAVISSPAFTLGSTYHVFIGGELTGSEVGGVYDVQTITAYAGGAQQAFTGTDVGRFRGGSFGGRGGDFAGSFGGRGGEQKNPKDQNRNMPQRPEDEMPPMPEGGVPQMPPEGEMPQRPEGGMPSMPEGEAPQRPEDGMPQMPADTQGGSMTDVGSSTSFYMQDKVNAFSGLSAI